MRSKFAARLFLLFVLGHGLAAGAAEPPVVPNDSAVPLQLAAETPTDSLVITPAGRVGVGTASPTAKLSLIGATDYDAVMRVRNTSSLGFSGIEFLDYVGTPRFFFGVNNSNLTTRLNSFSSTPFLLMTNSVERIRIDPGGNVGLGCTNPAARLVIGGFGSSCSGAPFSSINPGAATFTTSSSRSYKENLDKVDIPDILERVSDVGVYTYDFIDGPKNRLGLMAEDFHEVFGRGSEKVIEGGEVEMALWLAVQRLTQINQELTARNEEVEKRLAAIEARLQAAAEP
jgi:hypothetical protein